MKHKHDWQFAGRDSKILNEEEVEEYFKKWKVWLDKEYSFFSVFTLFLFKNPKPKPVSPENEYYSKFACECGKTKMVKEK